MVNKEQYVYKDGRYIKLSSFAHGASIEIVDVLPRVGNENTIYLIRDPEAKQEAYLQYIYKDEKYRPAGGSGSGTDIEVVSVLPPIAPEDTTLFLTETSVEPNSSIYEITDELYDEEANALKVDLQDAEPGDFIEFKKDSEVAGYIEITLPSFIKTVILNEDDLTHVQIGHYFNTCYIEDIDGIITREEREVDKEQGWLINLLVNDYSAVLSVYSGFDK